jgi:hypothetical protein
MSQFYVAGRNAALLKLGGTLVPVSHEGEEDNQTHQRQAQRNENMLLTGPGVSSNWDRFDDLIQNPAIASDHVRFVGE